MQAFRSTRFGGTTVLIGQPPMGVKAGFDVYDATQFEHTVLGSNLGGAVPALHVPRARAARRRGQAPARRRSSRIASRSTTINEAIAMTESGDAGRVSWSCP